MDAPACIPMLEAMAFPPDGARRIRDFCREQGLIRVEEGLTFGNLLPEQGAGLAVGGVALSPCRAVKIHYHRNAGVRGTLRIEEVKKTAPGQWDKPEREVTEGDILQAAMDLFFEDQVTPLMFTTPQLDGILRSLLYDASDSRFVLSWEDGWWRLDITQTDYGAE
jgi:hypothetical protein